MLSLDFGTVLYGVAQLAGLDRDNLPSHFFLSKFVTCPTED